MLWTTGPWARLFKTNDAVSSRFVKTLNVDIWNEPICFVDKCEKLSKAPLIFFYKNIGVFGYKVVKHLTSWSLNELIKLTMLWTTGSWPLIGFWWQATVRQFVSIPWSKDLAASRNVCRSDYTYYAQVYATMALEGKNKNLAQMIFHVDAPACSN